MLPGHLQLELMDAVAEHLRQLLALLLLEEELVHLDPRQLGLRVDAGRAGDVDPAFGRRQHANTNHGDLCVHVRNPVKLDGVLLPHATQTPPTLQAAKHPVDVVLPDLQEAVGEGVLIRLPRATQMEPTVLVDKLHEVAAVEGLFILREHLVALDTPGEHLEGPNLLLNADAVADRSDPHGLNIRGLHHDQSLAGDAVLNPEARVISKALLCEMPGDILRRPGVVVGGCHCFGARRPELKT
mmetsp:Transcript_78505/g.233948  ORF Transcript_78505/g.233948 Transcript_78505/m.233948 type:complete len:241 (+) Transcript_78505:137-859(+)